MKATSLAMLFESLAESLNEGLNKTAQNELAAVSEMLRRFPDQSVGDFIKFVDRAFINERESPPAMASRYRAFQAGEGEPASEWVASVKKLKGPDLKKLLTALGGSPKGKKVDEVRQELLAMIESTPATESGPSGTVSAESPSVSTPSTEDQQGVLLYNRMLHSLRDLSYEQIRAEFEPIRSMNRQAIEAIYRDQGDPIPEGSLDSLADRLLGYLEELKSSVEKTSRI